MFQNASMAGAGHMCYPVAFYFFASVKYLIDGPKEDTFFDSERWNIMQIFRNICSVAILFFYEGVTGEFIPKRIWKNKDIPVLADFFVKKMLFIFILCWHFNSQNFIPTVVFCCGRKTIIRTKNKDI